MKKKILALCLCVALAVVAVGGATLAYFTDTKSAKNTFTVGNVQIALDEAKVDTAGKPVPSANRVQENAYHLVPGHTYTKDPTVTVLEGSEESYVRMKVTFNNANAIIALCTDPEFADETTGVENAFPLIRMVNFAETNATKWDGIIPDNMVETEDMLADNKYFTKEGDTLTYYFYYNEKVPTSDTNTVLETLFDSITVPEWVTGDQLEQLTNFEINIEADAIQADGFDDADAAWAAFAAQSAAQP